MVLLYSARLSRRIVTRPGSGWAVRSARRGDFQRLVNASTSAAAGRGRPWAASRRGAALHSLPGLAAFEDRSLVGEDVQVQIAFVCTFTVAMQAVLLQEG